MSALGGRVRRAPALMCPGPGQFTISQDARAADKKEKPVRRRLMKGNELPVTKTRKGNDKGKRPAPQPAPPPPATEASQIADPESNDEEEDDEEEEDPVSPPVPSPARRDDPTTTRLPSGFDSAAAYPEELNSGCQMFVQWFNERRTAPIGHHVDNEQTIIMNSAPKNPIDVLCDLGHVARRDLMLAFLQERVCARGPRKGEAPFSSSLKQNVVDCFSYLKMWQGKADGRQLVYGDWDYRHAVFRPIRNYINERKKIESGVIAAAVPLNLDPEQCADKSIMQAMGHQSPTIFPEHLELIRMWYRALLRRYEATDYEKIKEVPHRGPMDTTGFSDYLWFTAQLTAVDIGANGGQRTGDFATMATTNFEVIEEHPSSSSSPRTYGLWNVDAFVKKNSGRGFKKAPHITFDRGVNKGIVARFRLISDRSKRKAEWTNGIVGEGLDAKPGNGIRLFLQPLLKCHRSDPLWYQNVGIGTHLLQPLKLIAPLIIEQYGGKSGMQVGVDYSLAALRPLVADYGPEHSMPSEISSVITGHVVFQQKGILMDKNMRPYQEQLAMDLENQVKAAMLMSDCGRKFGPGNPGKAAFTWNDDVPPFLLDVIRRTMPTRIRACDMDCRLIARGLIGNLVDGTAGEQQQPKPTGGIIIDLASGAVAPSPPDENTQPHGNQQRAQVPKRRKSAAQHPHQLNMPMMPQMPMMGCMPPVLPSLVPWME